MTLRTEKGCDTTVAKEADITSIQHLILGDVVAHPSGHEARCKNAPWSDHQVITDQHNISFNNTEF